MKIYLLLAALLSLLYGVDARQFMYGALFLLTHPHAYRWQSLREAPSLELIHLSLFMLILTSCHFIAVEVSLLSTAQLLMEISAMKAAMALW